MAIPSDTNWEVQPTGSSDSNGGGFSTANKGATGVDMTFGVNQATTTFTANLSAVGTTTLTCALGLFTNTMLGNVVNIAGQGFYCITGFTDTQHVVVDRALGTFTLATGVVGGALLSPAIPETVVVPGNNVNYLQGTYTISSTSANVAGGRLNLNVSGSATLRIHRAGYAVTHGDLGTKPIFQIAASGVTSITVVTFNNANSYNSIENVTIDGQNKTAINAVDCQGRENVCLRVKAQTCTSSGGKIMGVGNGGLLQNCEVTGCTVGNGAGIATTGTGGMAWYCTVQSHSGRAFDNGSQQGGSFYFCIANNISDSTNGYGFYFQGAAQGVCNNCIAYLCAKDGFYCSSTNTGLICNNCIASNNTGIGFNSNAAGNNLWLFNCAGFSNSGGNVNTGTSAPFRNENFKTLGATPFVSAGTNFMLNTTSNGGALCRGAAIPGAFPGLANTIGYQDIGAVQSQRTTVAYGSAG